MPELPEDAIFTLLHFLEQGYRCRRTNNGTTESGWCRRVAWIIRNELVIPILLNTIRRHFGTCIVCIGRNEDNLVLRYISRRIVFYNKRLRSRDVVNCCCLYKNKTSVIFLSILEPPNINILSPFRFFKLNINPN